METDEDIVTIKRLPDSDLHVREVRVSCPDATGLGVDLTRVLLDFGLRILRGDISTDGKWCFLIFVVQLSSGVPPRWQLLRSRLEVMCPHGTDSLRSLTAWRDTPKDSTPFLLQVASYDRAGMLHSLTHLLWEADCTVFKAHITTSPDGEVADMFWLVDNRGELPERHRALEICDRVRAGLGGEAECALGAAPRDSLARADDAPSGSRRACKDATSSRNLRSIVRARAERRAASLAGSLGAVPSLPGSLAAAPSLPGSLAAGPAAPASHTGSDSGWTSAADGSFSRPASAAPSAAGAGAADNGAADDGADAAALRIAALQLAHNPGLFDSSVHGARDIEGARAALAASPSGAGAPEAYPRPTSPDSLEPSNGSVTAKVSAFANAPLPPRVSSPEPDDEDADVEVELDVCGSSHYARMSLRCVDRKGLLYDVFVALKEIGVRVAYGRCEVSAAGDDDSGSLVGHAGAPDLLGAAPLAGALSSLASGAVEGGGGAAAAAASGSAAAAAAYLGRVSAGSTAAAPAAGPVTAAPPGALALAGSAQSPPPSGRSRRSAPPPPPQPATAALPVCELELFVEEADGSSIGAGELGDELVARVRRAVALPVRVAVRDAFGGCCTELIVTAQLDAGGRGRPRVTFDVTQALSLASVGVFMADVYASGTGGDDGEGVDGFDRGPGAYGASGLSHAPATFPRALDDAEPAALEIHRFLIHLPDGAPLRSAHDRRAIREVVRAQLLGVRPPRPRAPADPLDPAPWPSDAAGLAASFCQTLDRSGSDSASSAGSSPPDQSVKGAGRGAAALAAARLAASPAAADGAANRQARILRSLSEKWRMG